MAVIVNAIWTVIPGREDAVRSALSQLAPATRTEPGNLYYQPYWDPQAPNVLRIFEVYTDQDALAAHGNSAHFQEYVLGQALPHLESRIRETYQTLEV